MLNRGALLITGATGLLGHAVLTRLLAENSSLHIIALVRDNARWAERLKQLPADTSRLVSLTGDLTVTGLGLKTDERTALRRNLSAIIHLGADIVFSRSLSVARSVNTEGTRRVLELAAECERDVRMAYVSTAFVVGRRCGRISPDATPPDTGWVNAYEQSKYEAELLVRQQARNWVILRPSTIVCDSSAGRVSQYNAAHRGLRLYRDGLVAMMPGVSGSDIDAITTEYASEGIAQIALREEAAGRAVHLCSGTGSLPLEEMLDCTYQRWALDSHWRRRNIPRPAMADLSTYALFERTVEETADTALKNVTRSLSHFVPHLGLPKRFDTSDADALLGHAAPPVRSFWLPMVDHLVATNWGARAVA